ncbi:hypothetical protein Cni_G24214 [Canna indica]|uniref:Seed maturation-like protein n=1 Tax=Canna indica TaxID=4628 RepID=A0AAQ3QMY5_9LILI|nr:hypothetical protein Cni_G24214 [Canna indica]
MPIAASTAFFRGALLFPWLRSPPHRPPSLLPTATLADRWRLLQSPSPRLRSPKPRLHVFGGSSSRIPFDGLDPNDIPHKRSSKKSILLNLIQDVEPFDTSLIQKDVPANTIDAMKRTISGMLGLLPSDQFHVLVEALWEPLFNLLISSMKTGYTLRSAEYRLCLERNLDIHEEHLDKGRKENVEDDSPEMLDYRSTTVSNSLEMKDFYCNQESSGKVSGENMDFNNLRELTPEVQKYICYLQSRLNSAEKELDDIKRRDSDVQMQQFVGEESNDLLDYLRSLHPDKVMELSEPTLAGVEETIQSVIHGLLATLSPRMQSKPSLSENPTGGTLGMGEDDFAEVIENTSTRFQPLISLPRDYLARLLFWCMLLGHYIRGLEYRLELMELLPVCSVAEIALPDGDSAA